MKPTLVRSTASLIPLAQPYITQDEVTAVVQVLKSGQLSLGPQTSCFEQEIARYVGAKYAIAVSSGTAGLHLCVRSLNLDPGDEVITSPFSFVASTNVLLYQGLKPVFVDIDPTTFNLDPSQIEAAITPRTKAILPVHIFGWPIDYRLINSLARTYSLPIIEDACEALGATYHGKKAGNLGNPTVFAFYPNKQITTAEGGVIVTNSRDQFNILKSLSNQGRSLSTNWLHHPYLGYNYRLDELSAAMGVQQVKKIRPILKKRRQIAGWYNQALAGLSRLSLPKADTQAIKRSWFVYVIQLPNQSLRNKLIESLAQHSIQTRPYLPSIHLQPYMKKMFNYQKGSFPVAEKISSTSLALPFFTAMSKKQVERVSEAIHNFFDSA